MKDMIGAGIGAVSVATLGSKALLGVKQWSPNLLVNVIDNIVVNFIGILIIILVGVICTIFCMSIENKVRTWYAKKRKKWHGLQSAKELQPQS